MRRVLPTLLVASGLLGGCGGEDPVRARNDIVVVTLTDFRMQPESFVARRGLITFRARNEGRLPHAFHVAGPNGVRVEISTMLPGESGAQTVRLRRGEWRLFCPLANHEELGLYGSLVVR